MSVGFIMLVHTALDRAAETARHWATSGCPVVIHADRRVARAEYDGLRQALADLEAVRFVEPRHRCEWGTWGIVGATVAACEQMLAQFPGLGHVYLASGSCLPLRPMPELAAYLGARPGTDFIESVRIEDVGWCKGGFDKERFTLRFPFSYRRHRLLFDRFVEVQRGLGLTRAVPEPLEPHLGSQWWCLSVPTLTAILQDPRRPAFERYFRRVWIPDESYFQTMVRLHGRRVESRSLTLSKFDFQGRPHVFYDDHLQLLRRSDCFVARKIWPRADRLYRSFLSNDPGVTKNAEPNPGKIDRLFAKAADLRRHGRPGLRMQSRFPSPSRENAPTAAPYTVLEGFSELFVDFEDWLGRVTGLRVHGHLFAPDRAEFAGGERVYNGALTDAAALRDYDPRAFLSTLVWATRGERQCFMFGPGDRQDVARHIAADPNARVRVITGAWAIPMFRRGDTGPAVRREAALLQRIEEAHLAVLRGGGAQVQVWTLAEFLEAPVENLQPILDELCPRRLPRIGEAPRLVELDGFGAFLQALRNDGMSLYLAGDFSTSAAAARAQVPRAATG